MYELKQISEKCYYKFHTPNSVFETHSNNTEK
jgi:hypothetical protein